MCASLQSESYFTIAGDLSTIFFMKLMVSFQYSFNICSVKEQLRAAPLPRECRFNISRCYNCPIC